MPDTIVKNQVELRNVVKTYRPDREALADCSLSAAKGELVVVLGPSGCGKTTLLRLIAGLERPDSGRVRLGANDVTDREPGERGVAMVHQSAAVYPHMSVGENIAFSIRQRLGRHVDSGARAREIAKQFRIDDQLGAKPYELSGGQRQRASLARAFGVNAEVLLLDEPLANLDGPLRAEMRMAIRAQQRKQGTTVVYVTHDLEDVFELADRVAVMMEGKILQCEGPQEVYLRPANIQVAMMFSQPWLNTFAGIVMANGAEIAIVNDEDHQEAEVKLSTGLQRRMRAMIGRRVVVGVRSGMLKLDVSPEDSVVCIASCEWRDHGEMTQVQGRTRRGTLVVARRAGWVGPSAQKPEMHLGMADEDAHFFEGDAPWGRIEAG